MKHVLAFTFLFLTAFLLAPSLPALAEEAVHEEKIRILLITGGHSFEEQPFFAIFESIPDVKMTHVAYPDAAKLLTPDLIQDYDVLVFYDLWTTGITSRQQKAFLQLLQSGIGVVALHHTLAAHPNWSEYANIIGGKYYLNGHVVDGKTVPQSSYLHDQDIQATVAEPAHPITNGLDAFEIHDETYDRCEVDPTVRVLLTTNHLHNNKEVVWVKKYRNSRVCYIQFGHDRRAYENPNYRLLVARSVRWAAGRPADPTAKSFSLFNGKNLAGWRQEGNASWEVKNGLLIGRQGPNQAAGDLLTEASFDDFELTASFKIVWPANSGVWYRYQSAQEAYQADILEFKDPLAYTGSLYCPGKLFLAINDDPKLVHREGWNVLVIRAVGNRHVLFLNGKKIADIRDDGSKRGRIGFQIHEGDQFSEMQIMVKEVRIKRI